jgi:hypothetical protein
VNTEKEPDTPADCTSQHTAVDIAADELTDPQTTVTISISPTDHVALVSVLDESQARLTDHDVWSAVATCRARGSLRMAPARAEALLDWLRRCARACRGSCAVADRERALLIGRVALAIQLALSSPRSAAR